MAAIFAPAPSNAGIRALCSVFKILGATIVASRAGDIISEITLAMTNGLGLSAVHKTIHPYPTQAEVVKRLGDAYNRTRLTPLLKTVMEKWLSSRRR